jgi:EamA domain-containing membrane protein RarD
MGTTAPGDVMSQLRLGYLYGIGAYTLWGFMPLYIKLLLPTTRCGTPS